MADSNLRSADAELQQRASEYLALSKVGKQGEITCKSTWKCSELHLKAMFGQITSLDVLATVLEEMPPFPEKESSGLLNLLKKKRPGRVGGSILLLLLPPPTCSSSYLLTSAAHRCPGAREP